MNIDKIEIGERYTYYPPKKNDTDNIHYPVSVVRKKKYVVVFDSLQNKNRVVHPDRLTDQLELL